MVNSEITIADNLLKLARRVGSDGSFDLEDLLKAQFSKQTILNWLKDTSENKTLSQIDVFLKELMRKFSGSLPSKASDEIFIERERVAQRIREIGYDLDLFANAKKDLLEKAKVLAIKKSATDLSAINPDIIVALLKDKTVSYISNKGKVIVRMKDKAPLLDGIIALKNCGQYRHLFR